MTAPFRLRLADCDAWDAGVFAASLSAAERTRADRYRRTLDRDRFVVRRGLLRRLLGDLLGLPPAGVPLVAAAQGKPTLAGAAATVAFNLSHSGATALFGLAPAGEGGIAASIGVDIEAVDARPRTLGELLHVARRIAPAEAEALAALLAAVAARREPCASHVWDGPVRWGGRRGGRAGGGSRRRRWRSGLCGRRGRQA